MPQPKYGTGGTFTYTGTAGTSAAFSGGSQVWAWCTTDAYIMADISATATASGLPVPAYVPVQMSVPGGGRISAVQISAAGSCYFCAVE